MIRACVVACLLLISLCSPVFAGQEHVVHFNLSLGEYRIGMSFDEATLVRPFAIVESSYVDRNGAQVTRGRVDQVYINDIEFRFVVEFSEDHLFKVIGQFAPADIEKIRQMLFESVGESEADSRIVTTGAGEDFRLCHDRWQFPDATLDLIGTENMSFATLALTAIGQQERARRDERRLSNAPAKRSISDE